MKISRNRFPEIMNVVGENTRTVIPFHFMIRHQARVWTDEDRNNILIEADMPSPWLFIFGDDAAWQADVVADIRLQELYWCPVDTAEALMEVIQPRHQRTMIFEPDIQRTTRSHVPIPGPEGTEIRRVTTDDTAIMERTSEDLDWLFRTWGCWQAVVENGIVIAAIEGGRMISAALTFARAQRLDDIGIATAEAYQKRGLSSACASRLVQEILGEGRQPVWTVFESNTPSRRISEKLGFETQTRCTVIRAHPDEE